MIIILVLCTTDKPLNFSRIWFICSLISTPAEHEFLLWFLQHFPADTGLTLCIPSLWRVPDINESLTATLNSTWSAPKCKRAVSFFPSALWIICFQILLSEAAFLGKGCKGPVVLVRRKESVFPEKFPPLPCISVRLLHPKYQIILFSVA